MKKILLLLLPLIFTFAVNAQTTQINDDKVICISQESANLAAQAVTERNALREEVTVLKEAKDSERAINVDLKIRVATETQRSTDKEAENVRLVAIIEFLLKNGRVKKVGLINIF